MALKPNYKKKEEIPAEAAAFYVERNGRWELDADGVVPMEEYQAVQEKREPPIAERAG